ncbi:MULTISPECIES: sigma-70 family RNA polymerase sigma factor [Paraliobacillus]|uniref:sigma-70 family RNA polymerase sigma factor n=1 Tax=Paraliobacillus TaxID=200903 RepID=UPI000DD362B5|nr:MULTISPECIES: sigma-70 family RNA polymerase sigma factor [Paraliobacillus]
MADETLEFENVLTDHENIIYYLIKKYGIRDPDQEFYQEGLIALWKAMDNYNETRGKFSSYAYFLIDKTFLTMIRTRNRHTEKQEAYIATVSRERDNLITELEEEPVIDPYLLDQIKQNLTEKQMTWFTLAVLYEKSYKEIAKQEKVTENAVKNWARLAKPKIQLIILTEKAM